MIKDAYRGKEAFDDHTTTRHSVSSPLPDQLKGAWFCVNKQLFTPTVAKNTEVTGMCSTETVPQSLLDVEQKNLFDANERSCHSDIKSAGCSLKCVLLS